MSDWQVKQNISFEDDCGIHFFYLSYSIDRRISKTLAEKTNFAKIRSTCTPPHEIRSYFHYLKKFNLIKKNLVTCNWNNKVLRVFSIYRGTEVKD